MTRFALPPAVEDALATLETSSDPTTGEDAFWTVQRFQNGFGVRLALPNIVFSVVAVVLALTGSQRGWSDPLVIGLMIVTALIVAVFVFATQRWARAAHAANARMTSALRRWRALPQASVEKVAP